MVQTRSSAGALGSTGVTPLRHYYDPLRLLTEPQDGYEFPFRVAGNRARDYQHFARSLRFLPVLSVPAVSNHPGKLVRSHSFVVRSYDTGFTTSGWLTTSTSLTRPN
jgi:hypothetical protein